MNQIIRQAPIESGMTTPKIMVVAPPTIIKPKGAIAGKFAGAENRCFGLATELEKVAEEYVVSYFNAGSVTDASTVDGIHLDEKQHEVLGEAIAGAVHLRMTGST